MAGITRGEFLGLAGLAAFGGAMALEPITSPNILLILTDDQEFRSVSEMPKLLSNFGALGVTFDNAYVTTPACGPSRFSVMTGTFIHRHRVYVNEHATRRFKNRGYPRGKDDEGVGSLGWNLAQAGYTCGLFGKWNTGIEEMPGWRAPGYAQWKCTLPYKDPVKGNINGRLGAAKWYPSGTPVRGYDETEWLTKQATKFMADAPEPWFCFVSYHSPHGPYLASLDHRNEYAAVDPPWMTEDRPSFDHLDPNKPELYKCPPLTTEEKAAFAAEWRGKMEELQDVDDGVEALCAAADWDNTYAFYLSDNGFELGEHRLRAKGYPYEESVKTPLFMRGPGLSVNTTESRLAANIDIAPTCYELAGLYDLEDKCDGRSLLGIASTGGDAGEVTEEITELTEVTTDVEWRDSLLLERIVPDFPEADWTCLRTGNEMYVEHETGETELYDLAADPYQLTNIAPEAQNSDLMPLIQRLDGIRETSGSALKASEL